MGPDRIKHLEFIQNTITRMNTNSFQIKGWTVVAVSALLALGAATRNMYFIALGMGPVLMFWFLDAYYLSQERRFRGLYSDAADVGAEGKEVPLFSMDTWAYQGGTYSYWAAFWSPTIRTMYLPLLLFLAGVLALALCIGPERLGSN